MYAYKASWSRGPASPPKEGSYQQQFTSKTLIYEANGPLNCLAQSPDFSHLVVAGRDVLKVLSIDEEKIKEAQNLRVGRINLNFSSIDVAWNPHEAYKHWIATAATNGSIVLWNLNRDSLQKQERVINEHIRTVNRVRFHPFDWFNLLSCSQDGTMRLWDLRQERSVQIFEGKSTSVRDVQFNPHTGHVFASAFENGACQIWDMRNPQSCSQKVTAHQGPAFCLEWHLEDRSTLATGGRDKTIKVWKIGTPRIEMIASVNTIASIGRISWRPGHRYHIASCALVTDNSMHIWDLQRPFVPHASFTEHKDLTTGIAWHMNQKKSPISVSKDNCAIIHKFKDAHFPQADMSPVAVAWSIDGGLTIASTTKPARQNSSWSGLVSNEGLTNSLSFSRAKQVKVTSLPPPVLIPIVSRMTLYVQMDGMEIPIDDKADTNANFIHQAKFYKFTTDKDVSSLCLYNAEIANECHEYIASQTWKILSIMLKGLGSQRAVASARPTTANDLEWSSSPHIRSQSKNWNDEYSADDVFGENLMVVEGSGHAGSETSSSGEEEDYSETEKEDDSDHMWVLSDEIIEILSPLRSLCSSLESTDFLDYMSPSEDPSAPVVNLNKRVSGRLINFKANNPKPPWRTLTTVREMLFAVADQGNVQLCVTILLVMGDHATELQLPERKREQWSLAYIDLLHRCKLWSIANEIIRTSHLPAVNELNLDSTTVHTGCGGCNKPLFKTGWACDREKVTNTCSICHITVKGSYIWCQGCSHGGHLDHMQRWFENHELCPTGCGHKCQYT